MNSGSAANEHRPSSGLTTNVATKMKVLCSTAEITVGPASRSMFPTTITSAELRVIRSPVPARSTTEVGRASARSMKSIRNVDRVRSPNR